MGEPDAVRQGLTHLQDLVRRPPDEGDEISKLSHRLPPDLATTPNELLYLSPDEALVFEELKSTLARDLRFEWITDADRRVWDFVMKVVADRTSDHVPEFMSSNMIEPKERTCFLPVEHLPVRAPIDLLGVRLVPLDDSSVPDGPWLHPNERTGCIAMAQITGTSYTRMVADVRKLVDHALRVTRIALRSHMAITNEQLRFRLGTCYTFGGAGQGWSSRPEVPYPLTIGDELVTLVEAQTVSRLSAEPDTKLLKQVDIATRWMERARFAGEPLIQLLYLFFALEALLGDESEKLKAHGIAFRQAMLGEATGEGFAHPTSTWLLYDEVRSSAVHGGGSDVTAEEVRRFEATVYRTLDQYLRLAAEHSFVRRGQLVQYLDSHASRPLLVEWLRVNGGPKWDPFLAKEPTGSAGSDPSVGP